MRGVIKEGSNPLRLRREMTPRAPGGKHAERRKQKRSEQARKPAHERAKAGARNRRIGKKVGHTKVNRNTC
jgi:hypothetical protein